MNNTTRVCAFLGALSYIVSPAAFAAEKVYAVIFDVLLNPEGKVEALIVNKVIDPATDTVAPVPVRVPETTIAAARDFLGKRSFAPEQRKFSTYTFVGA
jgi:hypothetical protein